MDGVVDRYKYPRTPHLPGSGGTADDERRQLREFCFSKPDHDVVVTVKLDGENTTVYHDGYVHARSIDGRSHPSQDYARRLLAGVGYALLQGLRLTGENLYAEHSIRYDDLVDYFYLFGAWFEDDCLNWDTVMSLAVRHKLPLVPVLYRGPFLGVDAHLSQLIDYQAETGQEHEGLVVRCVHDFSYSLFGDCCAKWVRANHVQTNEHWTHGPMRRNQLRREENSSE